MKSRLKLNKEWTIGERIAGGGFGQVFSASSKGERSAVIKLVPKAAGADRELLFVRLDAVRNVIPVIDSGDAGDNWALVMPRAEMSLRQHLIKIDGPLDSTEAVSVLSDIVLALIDLDRKVVHRDIKPENILLYQDHWCLADFGISRYAEASTAPDTQKYALSPPYAAPERWRNERATSATDVYSMGVVAFEMVNGTKPFNGPRIEDYREQHLHSEPPDLQTGPTALRTMISECLYKAPETRPSSANISARLQRAAQEPASPGLARLHEANLAEVARRSEQARVASEGRSREERRAAILESAVRSGSTIQNALIAAIEDAAPSVERQHGRANGITLGLGQAQLEFVPTTATAQNPWNWNPPAFDVVALSAIVIRFPPDRHGYEGRSHSLWFCDAQEEGRYVWFETAFMFNPMIPKRGRKDPFALDPGEGSAKALWNGVAELQLAWPVNPLDTSDLGEFIDRWADWFAEAAEGRLQHPSRMPERETPRDWRQK